MTSPNGHLHLSKRWLAGIGATVVAAGLLLIVPWATSTWAQGEAQEVVDHHSHAGAHPAAVSANDRVQENLRAHEKQADKRFDKIETGLAVLIDRSGGRPSEAERARAEGLLD